MDKGKWWKLSTAFLAGASIQLVSPATGVAQEQPNKVVVRVTKKQDEPGAAKDKAKDKDKSGALRQDVRVIKLGEGEQAGHLLELLWRQDGDEQEAAGELSKAQDLRLRLAVDDVAQQASEYWIGVVAESVGGALKEQLQVDGLLVQEVIDQSPAAEAGLAANDIILRVGDKGIKELPDLIALIDEGQGQSLSLAILRQGKEQTRQVTPKKRELVEDQKIDVEVEYKSDAESENTGEEHALARRAMNFLLVRPGTRIVPAQELVTPESKERSLTVTVTKEGDQEAAIVVEQDGEKSEHQGHDLSKLPADVKAKVEEAMKNLKTGKFQMMLHGEHAPIARARGFLHLAAPATLGAHGVQGFNFVQAAGQPDINKKLDQILKKLSQVEKRLKQLGDDEEDEDEDEDEDEGEEENEGGEQDGEKEVHEGHGK